MRRRPQPAGLHDPMIPTRTMTALAAGVSSYALALAAHAQPASAAAAAVLADAAVEELVVIGNSRATAALESPVPVDVVGAETLEKTGGVVLNQALQRTLPSFNFPQGQNASKGSSGIRSASLRGLSPNLTLVLVDGKRRYASAQVSGADPYPGANYVDINTLPASAISRIEVLRDGASAQYGSDAIAGVLNLVLREDAEGGQVTAEVGQYSAGDGLTRSINGWWGVRLPRNGYLNLSGDWSKRDGTDRSGADIRRRYWLIDAAGQPVAPANAPANYDPAATLPAGTFWDPREATAERGHVGRWGNSDIEHSAFLAKGAVDLTDALRAYGFANYARTRTYNGVNPQTPSSDFNVRAFYPEGFQPITDVRLRDRSATAGLQYDAGSYGQFDLSVSYGDNRVESYLHNSVSPSFGLASKKDFYNGAFEASQTNIGLDYQKNLTADVLAEPIALSAGIAYRREDWTAKTPGELQSYGNGGVAILDGPNAGKPTRWGATDIAGLNPEDLGSYDRDVFGGYIAADLVVTPKLRFGGAVRFEDYSDFGSTTTGKLSARYDFTDQFAIRAAVSSGYRAPSLGQLGQQVTTSSGTFSFSGSILPTTRTRRYQPENPIVPQLGGGPLDAETSQNLSAGLVWRPTPSTSVTLDAYRIKIDGLILLAAGAAGNGLTGAYVNAATAAAGTPEITAVSFYTNGVDVETKGVDIVARQHFDLGDGRLDLSAAYSTFDTKVANIKTGIGGATLFTRGAINDLQGGVPEYKAVLGARYSTDRWSLDVNAIRYGAYTYFHPTNPANDQAYSAQWIVHTEASYALSEQTRVYIGANNLFDQYPEEFITANRVNGINRFGFIAPEGASGAFYYVRVSHEF